MMRPWRRWGICGVISSVLVLGTAALATAAATGSYRGRTTQKQKVSLNFSGGAVRNMTLIVRDRCPDGHILAVTEHYPPMRVTKGRFGGSLTPIGGHPGERTIVSGRIRRRTVTGTIKDTSFSHREGRLCHGSTGFSAHHV